MDEDKKKTYSAKVVLVSFALGIFLCLTGCLYFYSSRTVGSNDVNSTIQQLTQDGDRASGAVKNAAGRLNEAQDTATRISNRADESTSILDRLQAELEGIAEANGLDE